jgi:hypothetical protein
MSSEKADNRTPTRRSALASIVVGLACLSAGVYGVVDSWWFGVNSKPAVATVVEIDHSAEIDTLEFTVDGKPFRAQARGAFGLHWGPSHGMRARVPILYVVNDPNNARLAHFSARFTMPLILLVLGLMFAPAGWLLRRDSKRLSNEELERFRDPFRNC